MERLSLDGAHLAPVDGGPADSLVVLVHGYGSNGDEILYHATLLQPFLPRTAFVSAHAPHGFPDLPQARRWWSIESFSAAETDEGATQAAIAFDAFVTRELAAAGLAEDRLLLIGFSQGAMIVLHAGLRRARPVAGIVSLSGILAAPERLPAEIRSRPPILLVHGTEDDVVPFASLDLAAKALIAVDVPVETQICPGSGHSIGDDVLEAVRHFAVRRLG